jgi:hypothetical protein
VGARREQDCIRFLARALDDLVRLGLDGRLSLVEGLIGLVALGPQALVGPNPLGLRGPLPLGRHRAPPYHSPDALARHFTAAMRV